MSCPYISIIIATWNAAHCLERALQSIIGQQRGDVEILIQDAGSTDGTLDIVHHYQGHLAYVASEPDAGIYDAWNKALAHARGEWVLFLGADDFFIDNQAIARAMHFLPQLPPSVSYAYGANHLVNGTDIVLTINRSIHALFTLLVAEMPLFFSATFIRTGFVRPIGFNTAYRISSDLELVDKTLMPNNVFRIPSLLSCMSLGGMCTRPENQELVMQERAEILTRCVLPRAYDVVAYCIQTMGQTDTSLYA